MDELHDDLPRCGAFRTPDGAVTWRVWAPAAQRASLFLIDTQGRRAPVDLQPEPRGFFSCVRHGVPEGQRYALRLDGGPERPDPVSRWQPEGVHQPSALLFPEDFTWTDAAWTGVPQEELVIYELHVGTFTAEGTFDRAIARLPELRDLGITAVELMPLAQFPGDRGWGYDGVHPFAVQNSYGGPHGLQRFVEACHAHGLAVILDVVYNHLGPEGNYLGEFGPYYSDHYHTPWGRAVNFDDRGSDAVRAFVLENVRHWIRDFHMDGLRLDAIHTIYDFSATHILRDIAATAAAEARSAGRVVHVFAESSLNDVRLLDPVERGGYALAGQWNDDFHHAIHALLTGERAGYYVDYGPPEQLAKVIRQTFVLDGCYSTYYDRRHGAPAGDCTGDRFIVSVQNHDQVGNRALGDRFGTLLSPPQQRLAAGLLLLSPFIPMLFMGEEYGETRPFPFFCSFLDPRLIEAVRSGRRDEFARFGSDLELPDPQAESTFSSARLSWDWSDSDLRSGLRALYHDLLALRRSLPALNDFRTRTAEITDMNGARLLKLTRGDKRAGHDAVNVWFNLTGSTVSLPDSVALGAPPLVWSEAITYGGARAATDDDRQLLPFEFRISSIVHGNGVTG